MGAVLVETRSEPRPAPVKGRGRPRARLEALVRARLRAGGRRLRAALTPIESRGAALVGALTDDDAGEAVLATERLAGLGVGSTPAGDDYLVGVFHAAWLAGRGELARPLGSMAAARTTRRSGRWLERAAAGGASPVWRSLLAALGTGEEARIDRAAARVLDAGHTSGVASVLGFLAAAEAFAGTERVGKEGR